ncbi:MAG: FecR domain-containing protein [Bacteroidota bacterium]
MKITEELLRKYSLGACDQEEKEFVEKWLDLQEPDTIKDSITDDDFEIEEEKVWNKLSEVALELDRSPVQKQRKATTTLRHTWVRYAAAAMIIFTAGVSIYYPLYHNPQEQIAYLDHYRNIETQRGQKRTVHLPDGSTVRMNYETEIRVPEKFGGDERVVYLRGHAYFDVARNEEKPFIIYTEDTKTQVLGTSFEINTKNEATEIIVTSGKVAFSEKDQEDNRVTLILNDRAFLTADKRISTEEVDALSRTAWKDNRLVFDGRTLREIIGVIEPWFDINISVKKVEMLDTVFTIASDNPSLEIFMQQLSFAGEFEFKIEGQEVTIF